jgi:hypothetical protein
MGAAKDKNHSAYDKDDPYSLYKTHTKFIVDELVNANKEGKLVYCRFGKQYIVNLERQMNSLLNQGT